MKLTRSRFEQDGPGFAKVVPEDSEDLWHAYNLITEGDLVSSATVRKVQKETGGGKEAERVHLSLEIEVEAIEFDSTSSELRLRGKNVAESEHVKLGAYHTLVIELQRPFTLTKESWDSIDVERLRDACDPAASSDVAAVMLQEGLANVCLLGRSVTTVKARVETAIPRKRGAAGSAYDKALQKFFEAVLQAVLRHVDFGIVRCLILASPGFTKDQFFEYMFLEATRRGLTNLLENRSRVVLVHASSGYKHALKEVLTVPAVMAQIRDTKAAREVHALQAFHAMLTEDSARALYGPGHVEAADERLAIQTLLITDSLFRSANVAARRKYVQLVESVRANGGDVLVFSSMHVSGEQLNQLSGIAAILRFPLPDVEDMEFDNPML